jgi:glycosyltransferase involved in cell wall biosynthesis
MRLTIGIPVMNQEEETLRCLQQIIETCHQVDEIILVDNGSTYPLSETLKEKLPQMTFSEGIVNHITPSMILDNIIRNETNLGVRPALNQIFEKATGDVIIYTHNDVQFFEEGWDDKIRGAFAVHQDAGIIGAYGAKGIGTIDIYETPYVMQQLARSSCVSDARMDKAVHGFRNLKNEFEDVAVFDGFFMAIKKELLEKTGGFSDILPQHHNYDNLICIQSLENGYRNLIVSLDVEHLGGRTDTREDWSKGMGKEKIDIHRDAHPPLYEYGRGLLPIYIQDIYNEEDRIIGYELWMNRELKKTVIYPY